MRALVQRTARSRVLVDGAEAGAAGAGLTVLLCAMRGDDHAAAERLAQRIARLRILADEQGRMNRSLLDTGGECLLVSQFTLAADASRGNRPSFTEAADPETGRQLCEAAGRELESLGIRVGYGVFGADMQLELVNDGPVTIWLEQAP